MGDSSGSSSPEIRSLRERVETLERRQDRMLNALIEMHQRNERLRELLNLDTDRALLDSGEYPTLAAILQEETEPGAVGSELGIGGAAQGDVDSEESETDTKSDSGQDQRRI